ncbi:MAG: HupE/UreJ family protein [Phenylobacterium sp.]|uniref:HupE/UreJ family protein n=1 Tax=Phenylobacterium sp. TaxID=1871053 RepID=UPI0027345A57|nr:HupE/UreJ family protein [Phenylobacterium sp.]MDP3746674.1 HupE/UreJ family protein [Phenylobacterium sp.]
MRRFALAALAMLVPLLAPAGVARAHESRPLHVEITETQANTYRVRWRAPPSIPPMNAPAVALPADCRPLNGPEAESGAASLVGAVLYRCDESLAGRTVAIRYPRFNPAVSSLIKLKMASGQRHTALLGPQDTRWTVPRGETRAGVAYDYTLLGVRHIWAGIDHLLFLVCLLWIAGRPRRIFVTVTGFTLAHSVTLALAALQVVRLPVPPVEAAIALSIVFLATEIAKGRRETLTWRHPIAVSTSFGLLHGLGFAAVLGEVGLPQTELVTGLLFFNLGVELGQVLFAGAILVAVALARRAAPQRLAQTLAGAPLRLAASGAVGVAASYWLVERSAAFFA